MTATLTGAAGTAGRDVEAQLRAVEPLVRRICPARLGDGDDAAAGTPSQEEAGREQSSHRDDRVAADAQVQAEASSTDRHDTAAGWS